MARVCWDEGITNTNTAHHRVYGETRAGFGLGAQLAVCARAKAVEAIKAVKAKKRETCPDLRAAWEHSLRRAHLSADEPRPSLAQHPGRPRRLPSAPWARASMPCW